MNNQLLKQKVGVWARGASEAPDYEQERDKKFNELASAQRGEPETAMLRCQMHPLGAGIGPKTLEHVGDLTHRMSENFSHFHGQYLNVKDKVEKTLYWLTNPYGFEREMSGNLLNNYTARADDPKVRGRSFDELKQDFFSKWDDYAAAHAKLTVYNKAQEHARGAAISLGRRDFRMAILYLEALKKILDAGEEAWMTAAGQYTPGKVAATSTVTASIEKEAGLANILKGLGVALLGLAGTAAVLKPAPAPTSPKDKALNQIGHEMIKRLPQSIQNKIGDPNTITFREGEPDGSQNSKEIAEVAEGSRVVYINPKYVNDFLHTNLSDQWTAHETTHIMQDELDPQGNRFPATNPSDPYGKMKDVENSWKTLQGLRAKGDRMWDHSREEQAAIVQEYEAAVDMRDLTTDPAQKKQIEQKIQVYQQYIADYDQLKVGSHHKLYDHANLPNFYDLFESGKPGCSFGIYDLLEGDDWEPYEDEAEKLAAEQGVDLKSMADDWKDQWIYDNIARADLEAKFNKVRDHFAKIQFPLTVYRAIDLPDGIDELRVEKKPYRGPNKFKQYHLDDEVFGHCWAWDERGAKAYGGTNPLGSLNEDTYIFRGEIISSNDIDWETTLQVNFMMPEEHEIRVLNGRSIKITGYKQNGGQWLVPEESFKNVVASHTPQRLPTWIEFRGSEEDDEVEQEFNEWVKMYRKRKFPMKVWRVATLPQGIASLRTEQNEIGIYWTWNIDSAEAMNGTGVDGENNWLLEGEIEEDAVDWFDTLTANLDPIHGDDECEITLKTGAKVRLLRYAPCMPGTPNSWLKKDTFKPLNKIVIASSPLLASHKTPPLSDTVYPNTDADNEFELNSGEGSNGYANIPERVDGDETMPSIESLLPRQSALEGDGPVSFFEEVENPHSVQPLHAPDPPPLEEEMKTATVAIRRGEIDPAGAYFSLPGQSTYHDEEMVGVDPGLHSYDVSGVNIADTSKLGVAVSIIEEAMKSAKTERERVRLSELLLMAKVNGPFINYIDNDQLPLPEAAKRLGYDGILVWENDDIANPSSAFIWNTGKVKKVAAPASAVLPSDFEQFCQKYGGFMKVFGEIADFGSGDWEQYAEFYETDEQEEFDALPDSEKEKVMERRAYEDWEYRYNELRAMHASWSWPLKVWRCVTLENIQQLKTKGIGVYWSYEEGAAQAHWGQGGRPYTLEGQITENAVDWESTIYANLHPSLGEDEKEIRLKDGAPVKLLRWEDTTGKWHNALPEWKRVKAAVKPPKSEAPIWGRWWVTPTGEFVPAIGTGKYEGRSIHDGGQFGFEDKGKWGTDYYVPAEEAALEAGYTRLIVEPSIVYMQFWSRSQTEKKAGEIIRRVPVTVRWVEVAWSVPTHGYQKLPLAEAEERFQNTGDETRVIASTKKYLYHVTYLGNLDNIAQSGLTPNANTGIGGPALREYKSGKIFLSDAGGVFFWLNRAEQFAYHNSDNPADDGLIPVVLRVRAPKNLVKDEEGSSDSGHEAFWCPNVESGIEVWTGDRWENIYSANLNPQEFVDEEGYIQDSALNSPKLATDGDANAYVPREEAESPALHREPMFEDEKAASEAPYAAYSPRHSIDNPQLHKDPVFETDQEAWDAALPNHKVGGKKKYGPLFREVPVVEGGEAWDGRDVWEYPVNVGASPDEAPQANISQVIKDLVKEYGETPLQINQGNCDSFAFDVAERVAGCIVLEAGGMVWEESEHPAHLFIYYQNKFYDAAHPNGVAHWEDLYTLERKKKVGAKEDLLSLKYYLTMTPEQKAEEVARTFTETFVDWLEEEEIQLPAPPKRKPVAHELPTALPHEGPEGWDVVQADGKMRLTNGGAVPAGTLALKNGYGQIVATGKDEAEILANWRDLVDKGYKAGDAERAKYDGDILEGLREHDEDAWAAIPKQVFVQFMDAKEDYLMQGDPADCPSFMHMAFEKMLPKQWLIHKTDDPEGICANGFTIGMHDVARLGLTTYYKDSGKIGGYNFAFTADDARQAENKYGKHAVIFQAPGVEVYHYGDSERQVIFKGSDAHNLIPVYNSYGDWSLPEVQNGAYEEPVFTSGSLQEIVAWIQTNYTKYRKSIVKRASFKKAYDDDFDYDTAEAHFDDERTVAANIISEFKQHRNDPNYRMEWDVVPAARLIKIWNDYMNTGFVRDEKGINMIAEIVLTNIAKLNVNTILCGHSEQDPVAYADDVMGGEGEEELPEDYFYIDGAFFDDEKGALRISDYALKPLSQDEWKLRRAKTAEEKLQILDHILNIIHCRSDLSSWFVQGGRATLNRLAGTGDSLEPKKKPKITNPLLKKKTLKPKSRG